MGENREISIQNQCLDAFSYALTRITLSPIQNGNLFNAFVGVGAALLCTHFRRFSIIEYIVNLLNFTLIFHRCPNSQIATTPLTQESD